MFVWVSQSWQVFTEEKHQGLGGRKTAIPRAFNTVTWAVFIAISEVAAPQTSQLPGGFCAGSWCLSLGFSQHLNCTFEALCTRQLQTEILPISSPVKLASIWRLKEPDHMSVRTFFISLAFQTHLEWHSPPLIASLHCFLLLLLFIQNVWFCTMKLICVFT